MQRLMGTQKLFTTKTKKISMKKIQNDQSLWEMSGEYKQSMIQYIHKFPEILYHSLQHQKLDAARWLISLSDIPKEPIVTRLEKNSSFF